MLFNSATRAVSFLSATLPSVLLLALLLLALLLQHRSATQTHIAPLSKLSIAPLSKLSIAPLSKLSIAFRQVLCVGE